MKGEVLHDYFQVVEGGGRLALTLGNAWGWPVIGGFASQSIRTREERSSTMLRELGVRPGSQPRLSLSLSRAWIRYRSDAQTVVYSGTYAPMAVRNQPDSRNILYCHTPPRFIYDQRSFYLESLAAWKRPALLALNRYLKPRYERAVARMDQVVVNSENVRERVRRYLGRESTVVYPPCDVQYFQWREPEGYYLSTARLDPLKRVDLVVKAFRKMPDRKLVVVSEGAERQRLEQLANGASNIVFHGGVSDEKLRGLIARCIATVYVPRDEDFGMSPVESMASGKPVVGVAEGGLRETIVDGETGLLVPSNPDVEDLIDAVAEMTPENAYDMREACERRSMLFRTELFLHRMRAVITGI